jgi:O-antigen/teichoic acid export membrane protein
MEYPTAIGILNSIITLSLFLGLIHLKASLPYFIVAYVVASVPGVFIMWRLSKRFVSPKLHSNFGVWKEILRESWPLALTGVFIMIYVRIDQLMLMSMKGANAVGYYAAAVRLTETFSFIPSAFMMSVFPVMSSYFKTSKDSLTTSYRMSFKYMLMLIIPIAVGTTLLSKPIISLIYGQRFLPSASALSILIWSEVFVFFGIVNQQTLISTNKQRIDFTLTSISALVNVVLNLILIPQYGIVGAGIATAISYAVGSVVGLFLSATRDYSVAGFRSMPKPILASAIMAIYVYFTKSYLAPAIIGGAIIFALVMLLLRGIDQQDIQLIKAVFRKEKAFLGQVG